MTENNTSNSEGLIGNATVIFYMKTDAGDVEIGRTVCHDDVVEAQVNPNATSRKVIYHSDADAGSS